MDGGNSTPTVDNKAVPGRRDEPAPEGGGVEVEEQSEIGDLEMLLTKAAELLATATTQADPSDAKAHYQGSLAMFEAALAYAPQPDHPCGAARARERERERETVVPPSLLRSLVHLFNH